MTQNDKYAVFGNPIKHSKSPLIHAAFAEQCSQAIQYRAVRVEPGDFQQAATRFFEQGGCGLNITVPFKTDAFAFADTVSERAQRAGAVNTLCRRDDGTVFGDNTDGVGLIRDMIANLGWSVQAMRVLVVGAGGAVRGILEPLLRERPRELLIVNRTAERRPRWRPSLPAWVSCRAVDMMPSEPVSLIWLSTRPVAAYLAKCPICRLPC